MSKIYFNTNLEFLRKRKGWTQLQLADKLGVTDTVIAHWEKGIRQPKMTLDTYTHLYKNELVTISNQLDNLI